RPGRSHPARREIDHVTDVRRGGRDAAEHPRRGAEPAARAEHRPAVELLGEADGERLRPLARRRCGAAVDHERHPRPPGHRRLSASTSRYTAIVSAATRSQVRASTAARAAVEARTWD